jgi:hypothetical protein
VKLLWLRAHGRPTLTVDKKPNQETHMRLLRCAGSATQIDELAFPPDGELVLFEVEEVIAELTRFQKRFKLPTRPGLIEELTEDEERAVTAMFESDTAESAPLTTRSASWLADRFRRALRALRAARGAVDAQGSPTGCLLPSEPLARWEYLILHGAVPLAWVRVLDATKF